ncbi:nitrate ABC transporter permease [Burkholderia lata]|uniref:Nitrate ABC transporter permease n=1 Tax=Burkholderia lata (strain ATCC 17760 / DSM 23089 / LMG 22485 / NCIMB 9086 / R18194 / 383) TaxID=482957 RepID=A0A6P2TW42_BURL3|nr:ABC transporter permease [Burkholderia lata]VWC60991.1 nitrate ABC transporter permease [Burkholderia lata]
MKRLIETIAFWAIVGVAWEVGVRWTGTREYVLPSLSSVIAAGWEMRAQLLADSLTTAWEVFAGFALAVAGGLAIGLLASASNLVRRTLLPFVTALQSMPKIALAPLLIVWFGYGFASKLAAAVLFAFFPIVVATMGGLAGVPRHLDEHFRALGASAAHTFWHLRLPAALPALMDGLKIAMPLAVIGAIVGEFIGAEAGLGHLIVFATSNAQTPLCFAAILMVTALAMLFYGAVELVSRAVWWRGVTA